MTEAIALVGLGNAGLPLAVVMADSDIMVTEGAEAIHGGLKLGKRAEMKSCAMQSGT